MAEHSWDPAMWRMASDLIQQAERFQRNFSQLAAAVPYYGSSTQVSRWVPPINVVETDRGFWVLSALPGVRPDRLKAHLEGGDLLITGEGALPACCEEGELKTWEIPVGRFERRVRLPAFDLISIAQVLLRDGLLMIELKKS